MEFADIAVIYQDHYVLIINKPAGIVIHPTYKHAGDTLWDALLLFWAQQPQDDWQPPQLADDPAWQQAPRHIQEMLRQRRVERYWQEEGTLSRPCLLHRLDKDTSGVVALARTERSRRHFVRQFEDHTIAKRYLAVVKKRAPWWAQPRTAFTFAQVRGHEHVVLDDVAALFSATPQDEFVLCGPLGRDPADRRRCVVIADGQTASTRVRVLGVENGYALLEVQPITGRTHQIRAHLAALGYAIVGDPVYAAGMQENTTLSRQFLHAHSLTLYSYPACAAQTFVAPLADDLLLWLQGHTPALMTCAQHYCQAL